MLKLRSLELSSLREHTFTTNSSTKLDISDNLLTDLEGIEACQDYLKWLNASHNQIRSIKHLKTFGCLNVLNLGYNKISSTKHLNKLKGLNALILNNNDIQNLDGLSNLRELNTLVVSSNQLENVDFTPLKKLQKLSASHNKFSVFPSLQSQKDLKDLKLNNNNIERIPDWLVSSCIRIKVLDLGNNNLKDFDVIENLCKLPYLENLNLQGNLLCELDDYHIKMKELFPNLKILDFKKMSDLYFKAIELRSKTSANLDLHNTTKVDVLANTDATSKTTCQSTVNRGFKSKLKSKDTVTPVTEVDDNDGKKIKEDDISLKLGKQKRKKHLKEEISENSNLARIPEVSNKDNLTQQKKSKKSKKRKLTNNDSSELNDDHTESEPLNVSTDDLKSKSKKKRKKRKNETNEKSKPKVKTGVIAIKKVSRKRSKLFDSSILYNDSISFGMGDNAWK